MAPRENAVSVAVALKEALVRETLERVADKWTLLVIDELGEGGEMRFTRLRERIGGVSDVERSRRAYDSRASSSPSIGDE